MGHSPSVTLRPVRLNYTPSCQLLCVLCSWHASFSSNVGRFQLVYTSHGIELRGARDAFQDEQNESIEYKREPAEHHQAEDTVRCYALVFDR